jgi:YidC/Oxa1 family membrane protein insertase
MKQIYSFLIYDPFLNILIFFYNTIAFNDLGLSIIFLTILIRIILFPISHKTLELQLVMQKIQPELKEIQNKYKKDPQKQIQETMSLYKRNKINPMMMYLFLIIQLPVLIALFQIFYQNFANNDGLRLYSFIYKPEIINTLFLGLINLEKPSIILAVLASGFQYLQSLLSLSVFNKNQQKNNKMLLYFGSGMTLIFGLYLPAAVTLYLLTSNIIAFIQQIFINKKFIKEKENELGRIY